MKPGTQNYRGRQAGYSLIELLISLAIATLLVMALTGVLSSTLEVKDDTRARTEATRELRFAMERMVNAVRRSDRLLLPLADNPNTNWRENVREQSVPPGPPEGASTLATAVLATSLGPSVDRDQDGWADANNDKDYLDRNKNGSRDAGEPERIDEDLDDDNHNDSAPGIVGIDDDGDGQVDEVNAKDNDEDGLENEDNLGNGDDDKDGAVDEDMSPDMNLDGAPGIGGVDDNLDGLIDVGDAEDDDEDGRSNEDWLDSVVFFLNSAKLVERLPNLNPVDGEDYTEYTIAENVTHFRVERVSDAGRRAVLVDITLAVALPNAEPMSLTARIRAGGGL